MSQKAIADAAKSRGWFVHWYDAGEVLDVACDALHVKNLDPHFLQAWKSLGPPWNQDHELAMAAAIVVKP